VNGYLNESARRELSVRDSLSSKWNFSLRQLLGVRHRKAVVLSLIRSRITQSQWRPNPVLVLLLLWGLFIVYATMLPFDFSASGALIESRLRRLWERPLRGGGGSWADVVSNVLLFVPWGLLLAVWLAGCGRRYPAVVTLALLSGALLSGTVELVQLFAPGRYISVVDLVTNTFGSTVGGLIGWALARWIWPSASVRIRQSLHSRPLLACVLAVAAGLVVAGLSPFEVSLEVSDLKAAIKAACLLPFGPLLRGPAVLLQLWSLVGELLVWVLAGGLFALAARESGRRGASAIRWSATSAGVLSLAIEALQLVVPARAFDMTSVALAVLGSVLGSVLVAGFGDRDARRWINPAISIWGLAVVLAAWAPPRFTWPVPPFWRLEMVVPFWSYFDSRSLADLADVVQEVLIFLPLGALLAARSWRQSFLGAVLTGLALGVVLEFGQVFLPSRSADVTDALSAAAGTGLGLALWRWGEWARTSSMGVARYRVGRRSGLKL
jgi:glycopeptide antibiotics resistance protein